MTPEPTPWSEVPPGAPVLHTDGQVWYAYYIPELGVARLHGQTLDQVAQIDVASNQLCLMFVPTEAEALAALVIAFNGQVEIFGQPESE